VFSIRLAPDVPRYASRSGTVVAERVEQAPEHVADEHARRRVLLIDDDADSRLLLKELLREFGCEMIAARSAEDGLTLAHQKRPDLILLDLVMPEPNGLEVLAQLKSDPALQSIPVVIVSIVATEHRGRVLGAVDFLDKPVDRDRLFKALQRHLGLSYGSVLVASGDAARGNGS
jgi:CheY-like chemotaxis protein